MEPDYRDTVLSECETLSTYEAGWRFIDTNTLTPEERDFIKHLADAHRDDRLRVRVGAATCQWPC
jgi:hypothetical protein